MPGSNGGQALWMQPLSDWMPVLIASLRGGVQKGALSQALQKQKLK